MPHFDLFPWQSAWWTSLTWLHPSAPCECCNSLCIGEKRRHGGDDHRRFREQSCPRAKSREKSYMPEPAFARREKSYIGGTTPSFPNRMAPLSSVPSACFSVGTKTIAPGMMSLLSAGTNATIGTLAGMVIVLSPPL